MTPPPRIFSPSSAILATALLCLVAATGCGRAEYDRLVQQRISELRKPRTTNSPNWESFTSDNYEYEVELPGPPNVNSADQGSIQTETVQTSVGATAYQILISDGGQQTDLLTVATRVQKQYEGQGYTTIKMDDTTVGGQKCRRIHLDSNDSENTARVQVLALPSGRTVAMAVVGSGYEEADAARFFDSFVPGGL